MADVSERRIRPVQDAVESKNWKQALQLCEKWHKKGERSDRFQALRAYVLAKQQDANFTKHGRDEIVHLCNRTPAITDLDTIYQIQIALKDLGIGGDGGKKLWERAAAARPEDTDIVMTWLDEAIDRCDWQSAQKATMALRRSSPKDRNYEFWTIVMCYLLHQDHSVSEKERNMFGTLAYRLLAKAAEAVPHDSQELLSAGKAIQSPEELSLLVRVYLNTGHVQEAKDLLRDSKTLGSQSAIFKLDHDLHRSLQLEVLHASEDWPAVLCELRMAVQEPLPENVQISKLLKVLLDAGEHKDNFNLFPELRECLDGGRKIFPNSRDLNYGMLRLLQIEREKDRCTAGDLLEACKQYFSMRREQLSSFDELRSPLEVLDTNLQQDFVDFAQETANTDSESGTSSTIPLLNALKFEYCFVISPKMTAQPAQDFSCRVLDTFQQFCTMRRDSGDPSAQLAMLACTALHRATQAVQEGMIDRNLPKISHLQAAFLLRYCLTRCRDDYPSLVVLTRILTLLGAISLSATFFKRLSIKNLQWENAGHLLLTRLSTFHPQRSKGSEGTFDPLQMLDLAMAANNNSVGSVRRLIMVGLNNKSYVNVMETISLREDLKRSFSKQMYCIESARAQRLRNIPSSESDNVSSGLSVDRRDFSFIPSFGHPSRKPFSECLQTGPTPKDGWLCVMKICSDIMDLVGEEYHEPRSIQPQNVQELASVLVNLPKLLKAFSKELTKTEISNCSLQYYLGRALTLRLQHASSTGSTTDSAKADLDNAVQSIQDWLNGTTQEREEDAFNHGVILMAKTPIAPTWEYLHSAFSTLESLQAISLFLAGQAKASVRTKSKTRNPLTLSPDQRKAVQQHVDQLEKNIHDSARTLKTNLNASGVLGQMIDAVFGRNSADTGDGDGDAGSSTAAFGRQLERLPDAESVAEEFCGEVRESWEDALDGILGVEVKRYR